MRVFLCVFCLPSVFSCACVSVFPASIDTQFHKWMCESVRVQALSRCKIQTSPGARHGKTQSLAPRPVKNIADELQPFLYSIYPFLYYKRLPISQISRLSFGACFLLSSNAKFMHEDGKGRRRAAKGSWNGEEQRKSLRPVCLLLMQPAYMHAREMCTTRICLSHARANTRRRL
jgi:hypothetical protein